MYIFYQQENMKYKNWFSYIHLADTGQL